MTIATVAQYVEGSTLPDLELFWQEPDGSGLIDLASGWTFAVQVGDPGQAPVFTNTSATGATGTGTGLSSSDVPNLVVAWASSGELGDLAAGNYQIEVAATRTADSKIRKTKVRLTILEEIG